MLKPTDQPPEIGPFAYYIDAFRELSSCRVNGMGLAPIPFTAILEYHKIYGIEDFDEFLYLVRVMDYKFLKLEANRVKNGTTKPSATNNNKGGRR
jgi:hypothetical protein